ncbi:MAG TPA: DUF2846 domain-containing protein, partial [Pyrinomonadaceae bacterium]|nr:DUF2846 domain-containing protein [Pyrinomonadaceae bacterium]
PVCRHGGSPLKLALTLIALFAFAIPVIAQDPKPAESPAPQGEAAKPAEAQPTESPAPAQKPIIYFYRIKQFAGSALEPTVFCDEKELARMDNGRYFGVTLEPGKHTCRMGDKQTGFEVDMKAGQEYYAKITIDAGFWKGRGRLALLQPEQGAFEIKKTKLLGPEKVKNREMVTVFEGSATH